MDKRVLIAEDEPHIVEALSFILQREGYVVSAVSDGMAAFEHLVQTRPDMAILDVMLPSLSGLEILTRIRSQTHLANLPVLMLTAKVQKRDKEQAELAGASAFMTKPFTNSEVLQTVRRLLK
jgi:DNA-binding response OmpR family regulator